ncbi:MazG-like family protein [Streptacidiphilus neutrinimicus]|uniref:MazG-like family protein n=1 Tax=Streptacidiphilus neutrinimicus TaxID=105420 RepID=UPI0005A98832|nr:MazG-like family protein [Streptacidiphilus neutrinimicus]
MNDSAWATIAELNQWLTRDSELPEQTQKILQILKISEEAGEVAEAVIGATGQNPRKGFSHSWTDVERELCDVIITSMVALTRLNSGAEEVFAEHLRQVRARALGPS